MKKTFYTKIFAGLAAVFITASANASGPLKGEAECLRRFGFAEVFGSLAFSASEDQIAQTVVPQLASKLIDNNVDYQAISMSKEAKEELDQYKESKKSGKQLPQNWGKALKAEIIFAISAHHFTYLSETKFLHLTNSGSAYSVDLSASPAPTGVKTTYAISFLAPESSRKTDLSITVDKTTATMADRSQEEIVIQTLPLNSSELTFTPVALVLKNDAESATVVQDSIRSQFATYKGRLDNKEEGSSDPENLSAKPTKELLVALVNYCKPLVKDTESQKLFAELLK